MNSDRTTAQVKPRSTAQFTPQAAIPRGRPRISRSRVERTRGTLFIAFLHVAPVIAIFTGTTTRDWLVFAGMYVFLALGVGIGLHRYFAHKSFKTSRGFQFVLAWVASSSFTDPIAFSGKHRLHHRYSDTEKDVHAAEAGFWYCWFGSFVDEGYSDTEVTAAAKDLTRFAELVWLHKFFFIPGLCLVALTFALGGFSMFAIGYCLSVALLMNLTSTVNYFCHKYGTRRFDTPDRSRNNGWVALFSFGEGWHNNHHRYPTSARAGLMWWEFDLLYWVIKLLQVTGLIWDVRDVPDEVRQAASVG